MDFTQPAVKLERLIRGLNPWPSAYTLLDGKTLKVWQAEVEEDKFQENAAVESTKPGEVIEVRRDSIAVKTGEGILVMKELQLEGKKRMTADAFLRGYPITPGTMLG
jgi:methionyl-tRNA formyltransferase